MCFWCFLLKSSQSFAVFFFFKDFWSLLLKIFFHICLPLTPWYNIGVDLCIRLSTCLFVHVWVNIDSSGNPSNQLTQINLASHFLDIGKQCRPRSNAVECSIWSGSSLFANKNIYSKQNKNENTPKIGNGLIQLIYGWTGPLGKCGSSSLLLNCKCKSIQILQSMYTVPYDLDLWQFAIRNTTTFCRVFFTEI